MDAFVVSSFGQFIASLFSPHLSPRSWVSFLYLAYGWSVSKSSHTVANYIWLSGGVKVKHFSRYYLFLTGAFFLAMDQLWEAVYGLIDSMVASGELLQLVLDDTTKKKSGKKIEGAHYYRNGAGSARQEYRTLWGLNFVYLTLSLRWQGHRVSVPLGLRVYFKESVAQQLGRPFASRSTLGRHMLDFIARMLPHRQFRVLIDGGYATKDFLRGLPPNVEVVGRFPINSTLFDLPPKHTGKKKAGRPPKKGASQGNAKQWKEQPQRWQADPNDPQLLIQTRTGIWHSVLPGVLIRVVAIARTGELKQNPRSKPKPLEAFFSTDHSLSSIQILQEYHQRWDIEIDIRDANAYYGLGKDRCRNLDRITAVNTFRIIMAASRTLWLCKITQNQSFSLRRLRPWFRQKTNLSQLDISSAFDEALIAQGVFPTIRFLQDMPEIYPKEPTQNKQAA